MSSAPSDSDERSIDRDTPLRILYVVHGFPPDTWAGTEVYTLGLAREMQRLGHRCSVLTRAPADRPAAEGGAADFSLERCELEGLPGWRMTRRVEGQQLEHSYRHPEAEEAFRRVLDEFRPDVVHFQHLLHHSVALPRIAGERGIPTVVTCNDYWALCARVQLIRPDGERCAGNQGLACLPCVKNKGAKWIDRFRRHEGLFRGALRTLRSVDRSLPGGRDGTERRPAGLRRRLGNWVRDFEALERRQPETLGGYGSADLLIAPSRFLRELHLATGAFDPERFVHSDYGMRVDHLERLPRLPDPEGRVRFGFVGSLVRYKGPEVLLEAMNRLAGRPATLNVFGDFRPEEDPYHRTLRELARGGSVSFRGGFDNSRLSEIYREIDVLVVPSTWYENSPITIHEAFLLRTPLVVSDIGGMAELVTDGENGLHFRVGDPVDLAEKLGRFVDDPDLATRLGEAAPPIKTLAEDAREMEERYRALIARPS